MSPSTVLFVCVENACRSLMAEAMFNANPPLDWRATSAGTQPTAAPNPRTEPILHEIGLELPSHPPQLLTEEMMRGAGHVITMGCLDSTSCPARLRTMEVQDWALPDPAPLDDAGFRRVRNDLRALVEGLRREIVIGEARRRAVVSELR